MYLLNHQNASAFTCNSGILLQVLKDKNCETVIGCKYPIEDLKDN